MNDGWMLWLLVAGLAIGAVATWLLLVRLPRDESDIGAEERRHEAAWISDTIERYGGVAPESLVEEVLELHQVYLHDPRAPRDPYLEDEVSDPSTAPPDDGEMGPPPGPVSPPQPPRPLPSQPPRPLPPQPPRPLPRAQQQAASRYPPPPDAPGRSPTAR